MSIANRSTRLTVSVGVLVTLFSVTAMSDGRLTIDVVTFVAVLVGPPNYVNETFGLASNGVAPMESAIADANNRFAHVFTMNLTKIRLPAHCTELVRYVSQTAGEHYYRKTDSSDFTTFITPGCGEQDEMNNLAAAWNVPLITSVVRVKAAAVRKKSSLSPTYISTTIAGRDDLILPYNNLLNLFNWTSVFAVLDTNRLSRFSDAGRIMITALSAQPGRQLSYITIDSSHPTDWDTILTNFSRASRVCIFLGAGSLFRTFLIRASLFNMTSNDFVFLTHTYYSSSHVEDVFDFNGEEVVAENHERLLEAARSVLIVTIPDSVTSMPAEAEPMVEQWRGQELVDYNVTYSGLTNANIGPFFLTDYLAVEILGSIVNETLTRNPAFNLKDGKSLVQNFVNRTIETRFGEITFDEDGVRRTDTVVKDYDVTHGQFQTVMVNDWRRNVLHQTNVIDWGSGKDPNRPPPNQPECGFLGEKPACSKTGLQVATLASGLAATAAVFAIILGFVITRTLHRQDHADWWRLDEPNTVVFQLYHAATLTESVTNLDLWRSFKRNRTYFAV